MIILKRTYHHFQGQVIVSFLRANDIDAVLLDAQMSLALLGAVGGVRIGVPDGQEARAHQLLDEHEANLRQDQETDHEP